MADFERLVDRIYEVTTDPEGWPSVLDDLSGEVGSIGSILMTLRNDTGWLGWRHSAALPRLDEYLGSEAESRSQATTRLIATNRNGFVTDTELFADDEFLSDPMMSVWGRASGLHHCAATTIHVPNGDMVVVHVQRRKGQPAFDSADVSRLDAFRPHLARAGLLAARWRLERLRAMTEALALLGLPAAVLAPNGRVLASNALMQAMATHVVWLPKDRFAFADQAATVMLNCSVADLGKPDAPTVRSFPVRAADGGGLMVAHLIPTPGRAREVFEGGMGVLALTAVSAPRAPDAALVAGVFDLTPAEARAACAIAQGLTVEQIAARHAVAYETVRVQVKAVFGKTGTNRQSQVAALLAGLPAFPLPHA